MPAAVAPLAEFIRRRREPVVVQSVRSTAAAVVSYLVALWLTDQRAPLTAPLTALLVVQVTLYATLKTGARRVNAVVVGVLIAIGFSVLVGLTWWSLGAIILAALLVGNALRLGDFVNEVAISAMLVLGVTQVQSGAWDRVLETLIGTVVGLGFNLFPAPPVWVGPAGASIEDLARRIRRLLLRIGEEIGGHTPVENAMARLDEARRLDQAVGEVDGALRRAEDSLRLNPRVKEGLLNRIVLRTGLDTLEICTVVLRAMSRTVADLAAERGEDPLFERDVGTALEDVLGHLADAILSFSVLVTTQVSKNAEEAEARLATELSAAHASRDKAADLLLQTVQQHPGQWQLHGAVLAEIDRILEELDIEHRSRRLMEELDRRSREQQDRYPRLTKVQQRLRRKAGQQ